MTTLSQRVNGLRAVCARAGQTFAVLLLLAFAALFLAAGCRHGKNPESVHAEITRAIRAGQFRPALAAVNEALATNMGGTPDWHWRFCVLKAQILISESQFQEALRALDGELPPSLASSDVAVRKKLMAGIAFRNLQLFVESQKQLDDALGIARNSQPQMICEALKAIGELRVDERRYAAADELFREALALSKKENRSDQTAGALVNLARLATSEGHFDEAIDRAASALSLSRSLGMQPLVATILGNNAWNHFELGDFEAALDSYREAAEVSDRLGLTGYAFYWRTGTANSYLALKQFPAAEKLLSDTLLRAREIGDAATIVECLNGLSEVTLRTGRLTDARRFNEEAARMEQSGQDRLGITDSTRLAGLIAEADGRYAEAEAFFRRLTADSATDAPLRWQAEAGLAKVWEDKGKWTEAENAFREAIAIIERARHSISHDELRLSFLSSGIAVYGEYIDFLVRRGRTREALTEAELSRARTLDEGLSADPRTRADGDLARHPEQLAGRLHVTTLTYWLGDQRSYLWATTPARTDLFALPPAGEIETAVKEYRKAQAEGGDVLRSAQASGEKVYEMLVGPAQKLIPRGSRVVVLPDASLYSLNFETLIVPGANPHFWIEDATVSVANSLTLLAAGAAHHSSRNGGLLLVGDAVQATEEFPVLQQARPEMALVESHFRQTPRAILAKEKATAAGYLGSHPEQYAYLHFVTHGVASRARPLESAVILSPQGDSYKLYARDIVARPLHAELVTISACNGSGTRAYSGEGLVGLSWAFLRAGAHNVIGALWEVSDTATPQLMDRLYSGIAAGQDPAVALRNAKLSFLHSGNVYAKPFYWAPFQLYSGS